MVMPASAASATRTRNERVRTGPPTALAFVMLALRRFLAVAEHHRAEQRVERDRSGETLVDAVLHGLLDLRHRLVGVEAEAEVLEGDMREVEDLGAAELFLAVDLLHVVVRSEERRVGE